MKDVSLGEEVSEKKKKKLVNEPSWHSGDWSRLPSSLFLSPGKDHFLGREEHDASDMANSFSARGCLIIFKVELLADDPITCVACGSGTCCTKSNALLDNGSWMKGTDGCMQGGRERGWRALTTKGERLWRLQCCHILEIVLLGKNTHTHTHTFSVFFLFFLKICF